MTGHVSSRVSPFGHPRITARLPAPRGLSQAPTSFIGSWCQGIHRMPLQTCHTTQQTRPTPTTPRKAQRMPTAEHKDARVHYAVLKQRTDTNPTPTTHPTQHPQAPRQSSLTEGRPHKTTHTPPQQDGEPVPSGPNSVPRPTTPTQNHAFLPDESSCTHTTPTPGRTGLMSTIHP